METLTHGAATEGEAPAPHGRRRKIGGVRRVVAGVGRFLIGAGVVLLLFAAYQLWGTGLREAASQRDLRARLEQQLDASSPGTATADGDSVEAGGSYRPRTSGDELQLREPQPRPALPSAGEPVGILRIPKLGLDKVVVEGTDDSSLRLGPGHQPGTALPGMPGNAVLGGHRTTYGAPFYRLDELAPEDLVLVDTPTGSARYVVTGSQIVDPDDVWILEPTADDRLTLFTCTPRYSAARRLVVTARLTGAPSAAPSQPAPPLQQAESQLSPPERKLSSAGAPAPRAPASVEELGAPTGSLPAAAAWATVAAVTAAAIWWAGRRYRRVVAYAVGAPVLAVVLFATFERVAALLPSAV